MKANAQGTILGLLAQDPALTQVRLAETLGLSLSPIEKNIRKLKRQGLLRRGGPDKGGHWEIAGV